MENFKIRIHYNHLKDSDSKNQALFFKSIKNIIDSCTSEKGKISKAKLKEALKKAFLKNIPVGNKKYITIKVNFKSRKVRIVIDCEQKLIDIFNRGDESQYYKKLKNPDSLTQAKKKIEEFNHYPAEKIIRMNLPINRDTVFVRLGIAVSIDYDSEKKIFKSDKKTKSKKIRGYTHDFTESGKYPELFTNQDGTILVLYDPKNKIEVKAEGII